MALEVPMAFRAQVEGRCQLQRLGDQESDAKQWTQEWTQETYPIAPNFGPGVQTRTYKMSWRFVSNSGQDESIIRPVIGAKGWPFYPGSSMKGVFRRACNSAQRDRYCGQKTAENDCNPGILRFHGGYPTDQRWRNNLLDIVHPQQTWQVKTEETEDKEGGAFAKISLYKPELQFGISSAIALDATEWATIWKIWELALSTGIGGRVCAGYGQPEKHTGKPLYTCRLHGQGEAAKLIDGTGEFRPNIFRAAVRGHALRIFGGLTDAARADRLVNELFGSIENANNCDWGLLSMSFCEDDPDKKLGTFGYYKQPTYDIKGELRWFLTQSISLERSKALQKLIKSIMRFSMVFGGFGKAWRRADHRLFYDAINPNYDKLIGCHWEWAIGESASDLQALLFDVAVTQRSQVGKFIEATRQAAIEWMALSDVQPMPSVRANWREAWHPSSVQVWGRIADGKDDSQAIAWLHNPYQSRLGSLPERERSIKQTPVTGKMNKIGRLWHRMYPLFRLVKNPQNPKFPIPRKTGKFLELLTLFPNNSPDFKNFLDFLAPNPEDFQLLWGNKNPREQ